MMLYSFDFEEVNPQEGTFCTLEIENGYFKLDPKENTFLDFKRELTSPLSKLEKLDKSI
jgi:hypothetical protein